jgi:hypothetical protein
VGQGPLSPCYSSGRDFAVEVEGVRFRFSSEDFASRVRAAAVQLGLVGRDELSADEVADLVALAAHGRIARPLSPLAAHIELHRGDLLAGEADVVHWLRRLVFRGAWIDQQVADGRLEPEFDERTGFRFRDVVSGEAAAEPPPLPDWTPIAYRSPV